MRQDRKISVEDMTKLENLTSKAFAEGIALVYNTPEAGSKDQVTTDPIEDRAQRGQIHQEIRRIFKGQMETSTNDDGAIIASVVSKKKGGKKNRGRRDRNPGYEKAQGTYLHFTLYKENRDTMDAVNQIARFIRVKPQTIGYAGTKDRRASTAQRCSVRYVQPQALNGLNGRIWGVTTGDYKYSENPIHLGELLGNEFVITVKNCEIVGEDKEVSIPQTAEKLKKNAEAAINHMWEHGWINYFGHQRFGTHEIGTHEVGKLILGEKYEEAIEAILYYDSENAALAESLEEKPEEPTRRDQLIRAQACMLFLTGKDTRKAQDIMPKRFSAETCVLRHLNRSGAQSRKDFVGALVHITRGLRSMYLHAYQSHIWNHAASKRWALHGEKVIKGDLIIVPDAEKHVSGTQDEEADDIINPVDEDAESKVVARPLTAEEAASGKYKISDVVLPTPGYDVVYPDNEIGAFYQEFMGLEENGGLDPHKMRRMRREFSLPGRYRKLMNHFLSQPSVEVKTYVDDKEQMHPTDLDRINAQRPPRPAPAKRELEDEADGPESKKLKRDGDGDIQMEPEAPPAGEAAPEVAAPEVAPPSKIAVVVKFQLGRSAYATVALRELMGDPPEETAGLDDE